MTPCEINRGRLEGREDEWVRANRIADITGGIRVSLMMKVALPHKRMMLPGDKLSVLNGFWREVAT